jgi:hypothetical protein
MPEPLRLADPETAADLLTFAQRAATLSDDAVRLRAQEGVLVVTAAPLAPRGLGDATPTVIGMRVLAADPELICDIVVAASALGASEDPRAVDLPGVGLAPAWAGISPPRAGWVDAGAIEASVLANQAQAGIAQVAQSVPTDAGEDAVRAVRAAVWGAPEPELGGLVRGAAFAAFALGFISGAESASVRTSGPWTRLTLQRGHVLVRGPIVTGLTPVRTTGAPG